MYEEIFFVLKGRGATAVWYEGQPRHTFEWQEGSVFSIPLNAWHELYNASGEDGAAVRRNQRSDRVSTSTAAPNSSSTAP